jgi:hypothetical protein
MFLIITSCGSINEHNWNKGVKFQNLKIGDDLSGKCASFDIVSEPWQFATHNLYFKDMFIEFNNGYSFNIVWNNQYSWGYTCLDFSSNDDVYDKIIEYEFGSSPSPIIPWTYHNDGYGNLGRFYRNSGSNKLIYKFNDNELLKITSLNIDQLINEPTAISCLNYLKNSILFGYF